MKSSSVTHMPPSRWDDPSLRDCLPDSLFRVLQERYEGPTALQLTFWRRRWLTGGAAVGTAEDSAAPAGQGDVVLTAPTGSGKSVAFLAPALASLLRHSTPNDAVPGQPQVLVLAPTRELVVQVTTTLPAIVSSCT